MKQEVTYQHSVSFFEDAPCGCLVADKDGFILSVNKQIESWTGLDKVALTSLCISDLLTAGGKIYFETHLRPLLEMQGFFEEVALELAVGDSTRLPVLVSANQSETPGGSAALIRVVFTKAADRLQYEQNLRDAKMSAERELASEKKMAIVREQFIAVLGHDLRNPLGAIMAATGLLKEENVDHSLQKKLPAMILNSALRMNALINNIMDFASARLGGGIPAAKEPTYLEPVLSHATNELQSINPQKIIESVFSIPVQIYCDPFKIAQLYSNLVANAIAHGDPNGKIMVTAVTEAKFFQLTVSNTGKPITPELMETLFQPFTRQNLKPTQQGLGLGLYIAAEIAKAHGGTLNAFSDDIETRFVFRMPVQGEGNRRNQN